MFLRVSLNLGLITKVKKIFFAFGGLFCILLTLNLLDSYYSTRLLPFTQVNQVDLGNLSVTKAVARLKQQKQPPTTVRLVTASQSTSIKSGLLNLNYDFSQPIKQEVDQFRQKNQLDKFKTFIGRFFFPKEIFVPLSYDQTQLGYFLTGLGKKINQPAEEAWVELGRSGLVRSLIVHPGKLGQQINQLKTQQAFEQNLAQNRVELVVKFEKSAPPLTRQEISQAKQRARQLIGHHTLLKNEKNRLEFNFNDQDLISFINPRGGYRQATIRLSLNQLAKKINRPAQNAQFKYDPLTLVVEKFVPDRTGLHLQVRQLYQLILERLDQLEQKPKQFNHQPIKLPISTTQARIKLADTNNLGINQLIGLGESRFYHSIPSRIHNLTLAAKRVSNIIIKPGEEFSFNQVLGEVSAKTGFKQAYIIRHGRTELGDGGGVCQVSTTLFRALLDAGLKITRRLPHSYRVSYYELDHKPGIDATVYSGDIDLRFINDTTHHIIIHSQVKPKQLYMRYEIYGTSDGRQTKIVTHRTWGYQSPPPPEYILDPSLPVGAKKQIDWAAAGIKASFTNVIRAKDGQIIRQDTYKSNYKPWSAKYLVGPGFNNAHLL